MLWKPSSATTAIVCLTQIVVRVVRHRLVSPKRVNPKAARRQLASPKRVSQTHVKPVNVVSVANTYITAGTAIND